MPRNQSRTHTSIWTDPDFCARSASAQRVYWLLYSQPTIQLCGVLAYTPKRWASFASDTSPEVIMEALGELEEHHFIVSDPSTEEVFVRAFMRADSVLPTNIKLWEPAMEQARQVLSKRIRRSIGEEVARIEAENTPSDGVSHGGRPRARAASASASASATTSTTAQTSPSAPRVPSSEITAFSEFWITYPRRVGKEAAKKAWMKSIKITKSRTIIEGAKRFSEEVRESDPQFTPHPATWLNQGRWDDEVAPTGGGRAPDSGMLVYDPDAPSIYDEVSK